MDSRVNEALRIEWNERPIVRVEATVMIRGELGWTPYLGAGFSKVAIYENVVHSEYRLYAYRIQDKVITLDSLIPCHMPFTKANAIFHHWTIGSQRMGLAFNGTADARSFDRGIRVALENLDKAAAMNMSCGSSSTSDEPQSASPASSPLPTSSGDRSEGSARVKKQSTSSQASTTSSSSRRPAKPHCCHSLTALPVQQYRQQTLSSSSWQQTTTSAAAGRPARRHSSSIPGRALRGSTATSPSPLPHGTIPPKLPTPEVPQRPPSTTAPQAFTFPQVTEIEEVKKDPEKPPNTANDVAHNGRRAVTPSRRHRTRHRQDSGSRARRTKTPNLDHLERQRDLQPTKPNSYVQIVSSKSPGAHRNRSAEEHSVKYPSYRYTPSQTVPYGGGNYFFNTVSTAKVFDEASPEHHGGHVAYSMSPGGYKDAQKGLRHASVISKPGYEEKRGGKRKEDLAERSKCRYCQAMFNHDKNRPGSCPAAPEDSFEVCMNRASCLSCARLALRRCVPDSQTDHTDDPCTCHGGTRWRRWILLGLLSIVVPCLCLYPLLRSCHECGIWCHCCGGRHESIVPQRQSPGGGQVGRH